MVVSYSAAEGQTVDKLLPRMLDFILMFLDFQMR